MVSSFGKYEAELYCNRADYLEELAIESRYFIMEITENLLSQNILRHRETSLNSLSPIPVAAVKSP
jgi:hypothetical protein